MAGVLSGYNGSFEFKEPGQKYEDTPYVGMRVVGTMFPTQYHVAPNYLGYQSTVKSTDRNVALVPKVQSAHTCRSCG